LYAYRRDLADLALAGRVIASHYAEPVERRLGRQATLHGAPSAVADGIRELKSGERFLLLDDSLGWSWGYAAEDRRVGYVPSGALEH
jgi:Bacterial dipeptidyl-peptidase Sh3 domain